MLHPHQLYVTKQELRQPNAEAVRLHLHPVATSPKPLNESETSGRMHVSFDQDVDLPDFFQFGSR